MNTQPYKVKFSTIAGRLDRVASRYPQNDFLQREVANRLLDRMQLIKINPKTILDLSAGSGYLSHELATIFPTAKITSIDVSHKLIKQTQTNKHNSANINFKSQNILQDKLNDTFDLVIANFAIPILVADLNFVFKQITSLVNSNGLFLFSSFGPDTLKELKQSWAKVDDYARVNSFPDLHIVGDLLFNIGFDTPVLDREIFTLLYDNVEDILLDLKNNASFYLSPKAPVGLTTKNMLNKMALQYNSLKTPEQKLPVTIEVVYGHVWNNTSTAGNIPTQIVAT